MHDKDDVLVAPKRKMMAGPTVLSTQAYTKSLMPPPVIEDAKSMLDDELLVTKSVKNTAKAEGMVNILSVIETHTDLLCCKYNEDFQFLATGGADGFLQIYNSENGNLNLTLIDDEIRASATSVTSIKHRPVSKNYPITNSFICSYADGFIKCWNYNFKECIYTIRENRQTYGLTYHPRLPKFVTFGDDLKIYLYDEESRVQERILTGSSNPKIHDGPRSRVFAACFNPRSNQELLTGGWDNLIHFWDLRQPHAIRQLSGMHICGEGIDINFRGTEIMVCAFQKENSLQVWDYGSGKLINTIEPDHYETKLYTGRYIGATQYSACGGCDQNVFRVVDMENQMNLGLIMDIPSGVYCLDIGPARKNKRGLPKVAFVAGKKLYQIEIF